MFSPRLAFMTHFRVYDDLYSNSLQRWPKNDRFPASGSRFELTSAKIRLPDDCTVGFIVEERLGVSMVHSPLFHSHLENLLLIGHRSLPQQVVPALRPRCFLLSCCSLSLLMVLSLLQVTLSYGMFENKMNTIEVQGSFTKEDDPSRSVRHIL